MSADSPAFNLQATLDALISQIDHRLDPGALAALRRAEQRTNLTLMALLVQEVDRPSRWPLPLREDERAEAEVLWASILGFLVRTRGLRSQTAAGAALAEAGTSELRLNRLLRAERGALRDELRAAGQLLASKAVKCSPQDLIELALARDPDVAERARLKLARSYYRTQHRAETSAAT